MLENYAAQRPAIGSTGVINWQETFQEACTVQLRTFMSLLAYKELQVHLGVRHGS